MEGVRFYSTRTPYSPTSRSNPFTSTIPGVNCLIKLWKETRAGFCRACCHVKVKSIYFHVTRRADCALPMPPGPTPLWRPGSIPGSWADVCGFLKLPESDRQWKVRLHGAFSILREVLGLCPNDQSCQHEAWLHLFLSDGMIYNTSVRSLVKRFS